MNPPARAVLFLLFGSFLAGPVTLLAEVIDSTASGFSVKSVRLISASTDEVYRSLVKHVDRWWSSDHTWSGSSRALSIDDRAGGCFCEKLEGGGSVRHLTVVFAAPGKTLRMEGGLGPLQSFAVTGELTWKLATEGTFTRVELSYTVGGYRPGGLAVLSPIVDKVLTGQLVRLKNFIEKGNPD